MIESQERKLFGLRLLQNFFDKLEPDLIKGFIQIQLEFELQSSDHLVWLESYLAFTKVFEQIESEILEEKFAPLIKKMASDSFIEIKLLFYRFLASFISRIGRPEKA